MKLFVMGAALRKGSFNRKLAMNAAEFLLELTPEDVIELADFRDFEMPIYDGDLEEGSGVPKGAIDLAAKFAANDAIVISTPEYNGGIPGALKNALDWVSRVDQNPLDSKPLLLLGASPGALGAVRGLWHTRVPFEALGAAVYPTMFGLPKAIAAFDPKDHLSDAKTVERLKKLLSEFRTYADRLTRV
jgi:chromate reductase, NAD(P)H dehydrogenase (quinone)